VSDKDTITLPREVAELIENLMHHAYNDGVKQLKYRSSQTVEAEEALRAALAAPRPEPSGYAYRYADGVLRLNDGSQFNGGWPVEAVPYWFAPPENEALRRDAERYRWLREKDGIAVDVTVFGSMEANLDAAIDAAMKGDKT